jgi:hypothetical protein
MKRNPKPFSVEIKKSRVHGQRHQLPPKALLESTPLQATKSCQEEEPQAVAKPSAAPRILPSILEPVRSHSEAVEPVRRKSSPRSKLDQDHVEFGLSAIASEGATCSPTETAAMLEAVLQTDTSPIEEAASPALEVQTIEAESAEAKSPRPRKKALKTVGPLTDPRPALQTETASETQLIEAVSVNRSRGADHRRLTKRLAAAAQLPRHERWKRRLHAAVW